MDLLLASRREERKPRGKHGILLEDATNPANNPYDPNATGRFVAESVADFAQLAIDTAAEARRKATPEGDLPLLWGARYEETAPTSA